MIRSFHVFWKQIQYENYRIQNAVCNIAIWWIQTILSRSLPNPRITNEEVTRVYPHFVFLFFIIFYIFYIFKYFFIFFRNLSYFLHSSIFAPRLRLFFYFYIPCRNDMQKNSFIHKEFIYQAHFMTTISLHNAQIVSQFLKYTLRDYQI